MSVPTAIALVPLDERPVCVRLPAQIAAVAGVRVVRPGPDQLPEVRRPGDPAGLAAWLRATAPDVDVAVVSLEGLGFGGLIASRVGAEDEPEVAARWEALRDLGLPVHAFGVVLRTPDADDAGEEPDYFASYGRALHALPATLHDHGRGVGDVPAAVAADFFGRRLRNHLLNLRALRLAQGGVIDTLVLGGDDSACRTVGAAEHDWLRDWIGWLGLTNRAYAYQGADEIAGVLVARALTASPSEPLRVALTAVDEPALWRVPAYEARPLLESVRQQIAAAGAAVADDLEDADLVLVVQPPVPGGGDFATREPGVVDPTTRETGRLAARLIAAGQSVAIADCGYANGAAEPLVHALRDGIRPLDRLAAFAGWNTAGNTVGSALAHGLARVAAERLGRFDARAHGALLRHRLLEDWGWMSRERARVREVLGSDPARHDQLPSDSPAARLAEQGLADRLAELDPDWRIVPGSLRFPWRRTFEIDFDLTTDVP